LSLDVHSAQCPAKQNQHHGTLGTARLGDLVPYRIAAIALQECGATLDDTRRRAFANEMQEFGGGLRPSLAYMILWLMIIYHADPGSGTAQGLEQLATVARRSLPRERSHLG